MTPRILAQAAQELTFQQLKWEGLQNKQTEEETGNSIFKTLSSLRHFAQNVY